MVAPVPNRSRKQPWWMAQDQDWAESHVTASHHDALYRFGEYVMFTLLWTAKDAEDGLVGPCTNCMGGRISQAYDEVPDPYCTRCYGTTFEGGFRAQIIRPAIVTDRNTETKEAQRGEFTLDAVSIETTSDFFSRSGDLMFRADGSRYQMDQMDTVVIRSGFSHPQQVETVGGVIPSAKLEANLAAPAHRIPPAGDVLAQMLAAASQDRHLVTGVHRQDVVRGPLVPPRL